MSLFDLGNLGEDDRLLLARAEDWVRGCRNGRPRYSQFLDTRQQQLAEAAAERGGVRWRLWGGYEGAERRVIGLVANDAWDADEALADGAFPIAVLTVTSREAFGHRDLLGSLMSLRIDRGCIGDIALGENGAVVQATETAAAIIIDELTRVGGASVKVARGGTPEPSEHPEVVTGTVASLRLDSALALGLRLSRENAQALVKAGRVQRNHAETLSASEPVREGDVLSVAGHGRVVVSEIGGASRKGRLFLTLTVYL